MSVCCSTRWTMGWHMPLHVIMLLTGSKWWEDRVVCELTTNAGMLGRHDRCDCSPMTLLAIEHCLCLATLCKAVDGIVDVILLILPW